MGRVLWQLLRPHTLTASFVPVFIGSVLALPTEHFKAGLSVMMLLSSILLQSAVNMFNEYYDYRRGLDHANSVGIGGAIVRDELAPQRVFQLGVGFVVIALFLGIQIMRESSWQILPWGLVCIAVGYFYSGGPYPISATPFGELAAGSCMGIGIISIAYFIHTLTAPLLVFLIATAPSMMIGAILMANNIRDLDEDRRYGRKTIAVLIGKGKAVWVLAGMFLFSYLWIAGLVASRQISPWTLLVLFGLPKALKSVAMFRQGTRPQELMPAMVATAQVNTLFGVLLAIGLLLAA
ncbi:MAG: 1,4-dihydroxy-2-naphthoate polyprenyltransferase [Negativicutes bacterium]